MRDENIEIRTISFTELLNRMRMLGISIGQDALRNGIAQGAFPFATAIAPGESSGRHMVYIIFERLFDEWVAERATPRQQEAKSA